VKIAFVNPPRIARRAAVQAEDCCWGAGPLVLPAQLLACATEAARAGHEVAFIDLAIDKAAVLRDYAPDLIIHALVWQWWEPVNTVMSEAANGVPRLVLAVPPGYASRFAGIPEPHRPLAVAYSEPEAVIRDLPRQAADLGEWCWAVRGVAHARRYGILHRNPQRPNCLGELGPVDFSLVPDEYWSCYQAACYQVTRGCPYRCTFCVWGGSTCTDPSFKTRPAQLVANDLRELRARAGREIPLYLLAAQLTTSQRWIEEFYQAIQPLPYPFQSNVNMKDLTPDKLRLLQDAGLVSAAAGLDGASDGILRLMHKPYTMEEATAGLLAMQDAGLLKRARVRYGVGETDADVAEAIEWLDRLQNAGVRHLRANIAQILHYEGTQIYRDCRYALIDLPHGGSAPRLVQRDTANWSPYIARLKELKWLGRVGARK